jgi:hypothetical protein
MPASATFSGTRARCASATRASASWCQSGKLAAMTKQGTSPWWRRLAAWLGEKIAGHVLGYIVTALFSLFGVAVLISWLSGIEEFLFSQRTIGGWVLAVLDVAVILFGAATIALLRYLRRLKRAHTAELAIVTAAAVPKAQPAFRPIDVNDERLSLRWIIRQRPENWLHLQGILRRVSPGAVRDILDGPFHANAKCLERLEEREAGYGGGNERSPLLWELCPGCGEHLFNVPRRNLETVFVQSWTVRAQAVEELQRMHRSGIAIEGSRLTLQNPKYWQDMRPPGSQAD